jgi:hypothetical protein
MTLHQAFLSNSDGFAKLLELAGATFIRPGWRLIPIVLLILLLLVPLSVAVWTHIDYLLRKRKGKAARRLADFGFSLLATAAVCVPVMLR